jgi:hypothetical protein
VLLPAQNHTRAANYISEKTGIAVYLPEQDPRAVEPGELVAVKEIGKYEVYAERRVLGMEAFKFMHDYAILTDKKELIVCDNAIGDENGKALVQPGNLPLNPPFPPEDSENKEFRDLSRQPFKDLARKIGATSLLSGHGYDIIGTLQEASHL